MSRRQNTQRNKKQWNTGLHWEESVGAGVAKTDMDSDPQRKATGLVTWEKGTA